MVEARFLVIPCEAEGHGGLAVIWDRLEEQVVDVISADEAQRYADDGSL